MPYHEAHSKRHAFSSQPCNASDVVYPTDPSDFPCPALPCPSIITVLHFLAQTVLLTWQWGPLPNAGPISILIAAWLTRHLRHLTRKSGKALRQRLRRWRHEARWEWRRGAVGHWRQSWHLAIPYHFSNFTRIEARWWESWRQSRKATRRMERRCSRSWKSTRQWDGNNGRCSASGCASKARQLSSTSA